MENKIQTISSDEDDDNSNDSCAQSNTARFQKASFIQGTKNLSAYGAESGSCGKASQNSSLVDVLRQRVSLGNCRGENLGTKRVLCFDENHASPPQKRLRSGSSTDSDPAEFREQNSQDRRSASSTISQLEHRSFDNRDDRFNRCTSLPSYASKASCPPSNERLKTSPNRENDDASPVIEIVSPVFDSLHKRPNSYSNREVVELSSSDSDDSYLWNSSQVVVPSKIPNSENAAEETIDLDSLDSRSRSVSPVILQDVPPTCTEFRQGSCDTSQNSSDNKIHTATGDSNSGDVREACFRVTPLLRFSGAEKSCCESRKEGECCHTSKPNEQLKCHVQNASKSTLKIPLSIVPGDEHRNSLQHVSTSSLQTALASVWAPILPGSKGAKIAPLSAVGQLGSNCFVAGPAFTAKTVDRTCSANSANATTVSKSSNSLHSGKAVLGDALPGNIEGLCNTTTWSSETSAAGGTRPDQAKSNPRRQSFTPLNGNIILANEGNNSPNAPNNGNNSETKVSSYLRTVPSASHRSDQGDRLAFDSQRPSEKQTSETNKPLSSNISIDLLSKGIDNSSVPGGETFWSDDDLFEDYALTQADKAIETALCDHRLSDAGASEIHKLPSSVHPGKGTGDDIADPKSDMLYSQLDETIIIDDSDDEIFANLTQAFMSPPAVSKRSDSDDDTIDEAWNDDDDDIDLMLLQVDESCFIVPDDDKVVDLKPDLKPESCDSEGDGGEMDVDASQPLISSLIPPAEFLHREFKLERLLCSESTSLHTEIRFGGNRDDENRARAYSRGSEGDCDLPEISLDQVCALQNPDPVSNSVMESSKYEKQYEKETKSMIQEASDSDDDVPIFKRVEMQRNKCYLERNVKSGKAPVVEEDENYEDDFELPRFDCVAGQFVRPCVTGLRMASFKPILEVEVDDESESECEPETCNQVLPDQTEPKKEPQIDSGDELKIKKEQTESKKETQTHSGDELKNRKEESNYNYLENLEHLTEVSRFYGLNADHDEHVPWLSKTSPPKVKAAEPSDLPRKAKRQKKDEKAKIPTAPQKRKEASQSVKQKIKIAQLRNSNEHLKKMLKKPPASRRVASNDYEIDVGIEQAKLALKERKEAIEREKENARKVEESSGRVRKIDRRRHTVPVAASASMDANRLAPSGDKTSSMMTSVSVEHQLPHPSGLRSSGGQTAAEEKPTASTSTTFKIPLNRTPHLLKKNDALNKNSDAPANIRKNKCKAPNTRVRESNKSVRDPNKKTPSVPSSCPAVARVDFDDKRKGKDCAGKVLGERINSKSTHDSSSRDLLEAAKIVSQSRLVSSSVDIGKKLIRDRMPHKSKKLCSSSESITSETSKPKSLHEKLSKSSELNAVNLPKVPDRMGVKSSSSLTSVTNNLPSKSKPSASFPRESKTKSASSTSDLVTSIKKDRPETQISLDNKKRVDRKEISSVCGSRSSHELSGRITNASGSVEKVQTSTESNSASSIQNSGINETVKMKNDRCANHTSSNSVLNNHDTHSTNLETGQVSKLPNDNLPSKETESIVHRPENCSTENQPDDVLPPEFQDPMVANGLQPPEASNSKRVDCVTLSQIVNDSIRKTGPMLPPVFPFIAQKKAVVPKKINAEKVKETVKLTDLPKAKVDCNAAPLPSDDFMVAMLTWNPVWMKECEIVKEPPPLIDYNKLYPLLDSYDSFFDYVEILRPLMLLEIWESMIKDWKMNHKQPFRVLPTYLETPKKMRFMYLHCQGLLAPIESSTGRHLKENDLIILNLPISAGPPLDAKNISIRPVFGVVNKVNKHFPSKRTENFPPKILELLNKSGGKSIVITYIIQIRSRRLIIDNTEFINLEAVTSIVSVLRQFSGLANLQKSPLASDILRPSQREVFYHNLGNDTQSLKERFNPSQSDAIGRISRAVLDPYYPPKICLLQGPPGTGKSYTIVGLVEHLLNQNSNLHILLCAPSNAGIDELCRRMINHNAVEKSAGRKEINFVRLGAMASVHRDIQGYTIQVKAKALFDKTQRNTPSSVLSTLKGLEQKKKEWSEKLDKSTRENDANEIHNIFAELKLLEKRKELVEKGLNKPMSAGEDFKMKKEVFRKADIVCTTLNHSGSTHIVEMMRQDGKQNHFGCIIVDEACQCIEIDCLIPLQYRSSKLVLVGDPEQLPPTVLSKKAADMNYGQSLFERLYNQLKGFEPSPVLMLKTQYRMHPDICRFSSRHFYRGLLVTDSNTTKKRSNFPSCPYSIFDLQFTQERSNPTSTSSVNPEEAEFIVQLCMHLSVLMSSERASQNIGIITPYQSQRSLIADLLKQRCRKLEAIEVGTVDGFQGREKDVIIVSCVRSNSTSKIGFLADRRRLNVSITRAKYALYAVGNMKTLMTNPDWLALLNDAQKHGRVIPVSSPQHSMSQIRFGCSRS